jgi:hypothetical protein
MFRAHVLIIRTSKLHYAASRIITLKQVRGLKITKIHFHKYEQIVVKFMCELILLLFAHIYNCILLILDHSLVSV